MSSSLDNSRSKLINKQNVSSNFCSTPVVEQARLLSSISVSAIDTNSSSSTKIQSRYTTKRNVKEKRKTKRRKQGRKTRQHRKEQRSNVQVDSDSNWETRLEWSVNEETSRQASIEKTSSGSENDVLFKDLRSPERVREAPRLVENPLDSPILRSNRWQTQSPERISFGEQEGTLPLKELPFLHVRLDDTDDEEDALSLRKETTFKTYLGLRNPRRPKSNVRIEKCKQWLVDVSIPTASSDFLWNKFVNDNYKTVSRYLAPYANDKQKSSIKVHNRERDDEIGKNGDTEKQNSHAKKILRTEMNVVRGYWNKSLQKWVRVHDVYSYPECEDIEFQKDSETGRRMTLNQFLRKCRDQKGNVKIAESDPSPLRSQEVNESNAKNLRKKRRKNFYESLKSKSKRSRAKMVDISDSELQRNNENSKLASRLNTKQEIISNKGLLDGTSALTATSEFTVSPLKRINNQDINDAVNVGKRRKVIIKDKPTIKSVRSLTTLRYERNKQNWHIG